MLFLFLFPLPFLVGLRRASAANRLPLFCLFSPSNPPNGIFSHGLYRLFFLILSIQECIEIKMQKQGVNCLRKNNSLYLFPLYHEVGRGLGGGDFKTVCHERLRRRVGVGVLKGVLAVNSHHKNRPIFTGKPLL
jgi:hypothetical protein